MPVRDRDREVGEKGEEGNYNLAEEDHGAGLQSDAHTSSQAGLKVSYECGD